MEGHTVSHYRVLSRIGGGGMGVVYRAEDTRLKRTVALKFLPPELTRDDSARERFIQEAQAASLLDHPNICTIYDVDAEPDGRLFIAMACYEGETLRARLSRGPLAVAEALDIARQIARGLEKAHQAGIVHRDIKPANVMVTPDGLVKILDFGIAKLLDRTGPTQTGTTLGTVAYMAPEQIQGASDQRADLWALGVVLYEMITGRLPFEGDANAAVLLNILHHPFAPASRVRPDLPKDVDEVLARALSKDPAGRYQTAAELEQALAAILPAPTSTAPVAAAAAPTRTRRAVTVIAVVALVAVAVGVTAAWFGRAASGTRRAEALVERITQLADADDYVPALAALEELERLAPDDRRLPDLAARISHVRDIVTDPVGVNVFVKPYDRPLESWRLVGRTPITGARFVNEVLRWRFERDGYAPVEIASPAARLTPPRLDVAGSVPPDTVVVGAGPLNLQLTGFNYLRQIPGAAFHIDKFEVTNRRYKAFVDAGGYARRDYWASTFRKGSRSLTWEQAMPELVDKTGRPGPSTWEVGTYPAGQDDYPVSGVSWYEADAFAKFSGRSLPTVYHWTRTAGVPMAAVVTPLSNLQGTGLAPVGRFAGLSPAGALDMAGNVKEWCANAVAGQEERFVLGGSWHDPTHSFMFADARPPLDRAEVIGFRLATYVSGPPEATLTDPVPVVRRNVAAEPPVSDQAFSAFRRLYAYDPRPLDAKVESRDESPEHWIRERVSFRAAYGADRVPAYVFLPKGITPPYQAVVFAPGAAAVTVRDSSVLRDFTAADYLALSGRAVVYPIYSGTYERNTGQTTVWPDRSRAYQDWMVRVVNDARRTMDYLESRPDIRHDAIAYVGTSWGASFAPRLLAQDTRFKTAVLTDVGFTAATEIPTELDIIHYVPRVTLPTLMVNGNLDFIYPVETSQKPFFERLGTPRDRKRHVVLVGGHFILPQQRSQLIREVLDWLDTHLGPVTRR